jgi:SAM-dependent methyltransferase
MEDKIFKEYSRYYDLLYSDKDYCSEALYVDSLLRNHVNSTSIILEFGCGTGKHANEMSKLGYSITGIEASEEMVSQAAVSDNFSIIHGDIKDISTGCKYDSVLSLFHVLSYQTTIQDIKKVFSRAAEHLVKGGLFIFDFWYTPAVYTLRPEVRVKRMQDERVEILRIAEPKMYTYDNCVNINFTIIIKNKKSELAHIIEESHRMRHFSIPEISAISEDFGFNIVEANEFLTGKTLSDQTWGACVVLKKYL